MLKAVMESLKEADILQQQQQQQHSALWSVVKLPASSQTPRDTDGSVEGEECHLLFKNFLLTASLPAPHQFQRLTT